MSNITRTLEKSLQAKTLSDLVRVKTSDKVFLLLDCSGSMGEEFPLKDGTLTRRIDQLRRVVSMILQKESVPLVAFGGFGWEPATPEQQAAGDWGKEITAKFVEPDAIPEPSGGTPMKEAILFARENGAGRLVIISDGGPADLPGTKEAAAQFAGRIDVAYIGIPGDYGSSVLLQVAEAAGGTQFEGDLNEPLALSGNVIALLTG
jgi:hypothetical protein